ncbi:hypothetical protein ACWDTR_05805 [Streptomyces sp. NPDC003470]
MTKTVRTGLVGTLVLGIALTLLSCGPKGDDLPQALCGTRIDPGLTRALLPTTRDVHEVSRVDRGEAVSAPCTILSGNSTVLGFQFYWNTDTPKLMQRSRFDPALADFSEPRSADFAQEALIANNGASATTRCAVRDTKYFTLHLYLPRQNPTVPDHRKDIENFMRVYFPATVKTLRCG